MVVTTPHSLLRLLQYQSLLFLRLCHLLLDEVEVLLSEANEQVSVSRSFRCHYYLETFIYMCVYIYRRRQWHPTPVLLPGKSHGQRSLVGCSPWGPEESDTTERLHFHFSLSCIEEGNGNPLQCSCLENPRDMGAWWAAIYEVAQSRTRLTRLSSSSIDRKTKPILKSE